jgi:hypothetical protein
MPFLFAANVVNLYCSALQTLEGMQTPAQPITLMNIVTGNTHIAEPLLAKIDL